MKKEFPDDMIPVGDEGFNFGCHSGVDCFTLCCKNVDMFLYPYDVLRLKKNLGISSEEFMRKYSRLVRASNPYFPSVMLKLREDDLNSCPFLGDDGCEVYKDRPSSCRTYPLERAVDRDPSKNDSKEFYFLTNHTYCQGHKEKKLFSVKQWVRDQSLDDYNMMDDLWGNIDTLFMSNPWAGEGSGGPKQQLAFMVCYNIDAFRGFYNQNKLDKQFKISKTLKRNIQLDDAELLKFGFEWLKHILAGKSSLVPK